MPVICNQRHRCKMADDCGGSKPHEPCSECGNGPMCKKLNAKCEESPANTEKCEQLRTIVARTPFVQGQSPYYCYVCGRNPCCCSGVGL